MGDVSSRELSFKVERSVTLNEIQRRFTAPVQNALGSAVRHVVRLKEIFGVPVKEGQKVRMDSGQSISRRDILKGLAAATAVTALDLPMRNSLVRGAQAQELQPTRPSSQLPEPPEVMASLYEKNLENLKKPSEKSSKERSNDEKDIIPLESIISPEELKNSELMRKTIGEFVNLFTFQAEINGKRLKMLLPFAEVGEGYDFPVFQFSDGSISSKMSPEMARERFQSAVNSGELGRLFKSNLEEGVDSSQLSANEKLAYKNIKDQQGLSVKESYAFYTALRELGIYGDCNGTTYNALAFFYDRVKGSGGFDKLVRSKFPDLREMEHPAVNFNIARYGDQRWADVIQPPATKDYKAGDIIALGEEQHVMLVVGWDQDRSALWIMQNTDESQTQGLDLFPVYILNPEMPLQYQKWGNVKLAQETTLKDHQSGEGYSARLQSPRSERAESQAQEQIGSTRKSYKVFRNREIEKLLAEQTKR